jgi:FlaA1/EpsC-like NDP-sugar epimerase
MNGKEPARFVAEAYDSTVTAGTSGAVTAQTRAGLGRQVWHAAVRAGTTRAARAARWARALLERWTHLPWLRYTTIIGYDAFAAALGLYGAILVRLAGEVPPAYAPRARDALPFLVGIRLGFVGLFRLHRWSFQMSGLPEAARLTVAMLGASVLFAVFYPGLPRSVYVLEFFLTTTSMATFRFAPRMVEGWTTEWQRRCSLASRRTIIVGAGGTGHLLARDIQRAHDSNYLLVGFVDDDPAKLGMRVSGKPVLGDVGRLPHLIEKLGVSTVLLAVPSMTAERIRALLTRCASSKATFKSIPASYSHLDERISAAMLHDLSPDDLLPRDPVAFDVAEIREQVERRRVLVTGAAGSIGGEMCLQLARSGVSDLVMVDINENDLYLRARRLEAEFPSVRVRAEVADIRELPRLHRLAAEHRPSLIVHAAAHKHVPLMEEAPEEAIKNNVFGTLNVALMADAVEAEQLVFISTDKAVKPTSVMGASKRIAELVIRDMARRSRTRMAAVRFGNVLGSAGSIVPLFKQQIERGGPVTVTHPECTRYFMTISEAVGLSLLAGLGGYGDLCVLEMGKPIRIVEIAANLIIMAGRIPGEEIPIVYTGLRPGEKLFEELLTEEEEETAQVRNRIQVARSPPPPADLAKRLHTLRELADTGDREALLAEVRVLVPTYRPRSETPSPAPRTRLTSAAGPSVARPRANGVSAPPLPRQLD